MTSTGSMSLSSHLTYIDRSEAFRARVRAGTRAPAPVRNDRIVSWGGTMGQRWNATIKAAGVSIPEGTVVLAVRLNEHGQRNVVLVEAYEGDQAAFASFPRLGHMLGATEIQICGAGGTMMERGRIARELGRHTRTDRTTLLTRPLVVAGAFDRRAIMATACAAAKARQARTGETWGACLSVALSGTWALAKSARFATSH
ncbi:hypothetical protein MKK64_04670 [Methylobacterium sp. E-025]|uniref:hypothetical protein n=1 Tax=Methylobacterium sp. E-025 TaxID=2836561 RepID=UPI001FBA2925|nr:hypothetical protein [Methylobacterium sp. E-025]MCJ2110505.1 hypothetical protein [Methylobacterium sp. E-025]